MGKTYEDGSNETWEVARKIVGVDDGYTSGQLSDIFGSCSLSYIFDYFTASEVIKKIKEYEKFKVGDEVIDSSMSEKKSVVVRVDGTVITVMEGDGTAIRTGIKGFKKTGRHFPQIAEVLRQMQEDAKDEHEHNNTGTEQESEKDG